MRLRPIDPNPGWAYDVLTDRTHDGKAFRPLTVPDGYTRECLVTVVARKLTADDVLAPVTDLFMSRGCRDHLRSDNSPELRAKVVRGWRPWLGVQPLVLEPGRTATQSPATGSYGTSSWTERSSSPCMRPRS